MSLLELTIYGRPSTGKNGATLVPVLRKGKWMRLMVKKPALKRWEAQAMRQVTGKHRLNIDYPVNVKIEVWTQENRRSDLVGYIQAVLDFLVKALVLKDDSGWNEPIAVSYDGSRIVGVDRKNPRVQITISKYEANPTDPRQGSTGR